MVALRPDTRLRLVARSSPATVEDDAALVARALGGDRLAEETLLLRHAPRLIRITDRMLGDREETEDVVQDAFETALTRLSSLRDPRAFGGWILAIALRHVHRRFRRRRLLHAFGFLASAEGVEPLEVQASSSASAEQRAELALLDRALERLPITERMAWSLRFIEGLELTEIAVALDCSVTTVKRRITAADARVRAHVEGVGASEASGVSRASGATARRSRAAHAGSEDEGGAS